MVDENPVVPTVDLTTHQSLLLPTIISIGLVIGALVFCGLLVARFFLRRRVHGRHGGLSLVVLQILIPKFRRAEEATRDNSIEQTRQAISVAESFFSTIGGLKAQKGFKAWLFGRTDEISFEIVAHKKLIYFYIAVPQKLQTHIEQQIASVYPDAHIEVVEDYNIFSPAGTVLGAYLKFKRPSGFPIKTYLKLESDPLNALTNALSKVEEDDGVAIQYVIRPSRREWNKKGLGIAKRMQQGTPLEEAVAGKTHGKKKEGFLSILGFGANKQQQPESYRLSPLEEEAVKGIEQKASKAGMDANIRLVVSAPNSNRAEMIMGNLITAFSQYNIYHFGNAFNKVVPPSKNRLIRRFIYRTFE